MKKNHTCNKSLYLLGVANNLFLPLVLFISCYVSNFTCRGDSYGGVITLYALIFFIPQLVIFGIISAYFIYAPVNAIFKHGWKVFTNRDKFYIGSYFITLGASAWLIKFQGYL